LYPRGQVQHGERHVLGRAEATRRALAWWLERLVYGVDRYA
jgi:hypothetical protein